MPIIVHKENVDLVDVVRLLDEHDKFHLLDTGSIISFQFLDNSSVKIGLELVFSESLLDNQRESALFVVPEES